MKIQIDRSTVEQVLGAVVAASEELKSLKLNLARDLLYTALTAAPLPPPPECQTEAEKIAYAFGWWKALEVHRVAPAEPKNCIKCGERLMSCFTNTCYACNQAPVEPTHKESLSVAEPVAWMSPEILAAIGKHPDGHTVLCGIQTKQRTVPLFTAPQPQREPLNDDEIDKCVEKVWGSYAEFDEVRLFTRLIEKSLGIGVAK